jgi:hypothetical protein
MLHRLIVVTHTATSFFNRCLPSSDSDVAAAVQAYVVVVFRVVVEAQMDLQVAPLPVAIPNAIEQDSAAIAVIALCAIRPARVVVEHTAGAGQPGTPMLPISKVRPVRGVNRAAGINAARLDLWGMPERLEEHLRAPDRSACYCQARRHEDDD